MANWYKANASTDVRNDVELGRQLGTSEGKYPDDMPKCRRGKASAPAASVTTSNYTDELPTLLQLRCH